MKGEEVAHPPSIKEMLPIQRIALGRSKARIADDAA
jgi:hypothetical protein